MKKCNVCGTKRVIYFTCELCKLDFCWEHYAKHVCGEKQKPEIRIDMD